MGALCAAGIRCAPAAVSCERSAHACTLIALAIGARSWQPGSCVVCSCPCCVDSCGALSSWQPPQTVAISSAGCTAIYMPDEALHVRGTLAPELLAPLLQRHAVTHLLAVPSVLSRLCELPGVADELASLRLVVSSGDMLTAGAARRIAAVLPRGAALVNLYGSAETTADALACVDPAGALHVSAGALWAVQRRRLRCTRRSSNQIHWKTECRRMRRLTGAGWSTPRLSVVRHSFAWQLLGDCT